ncbi:uncharacterized protein LOC104892809 [Beta vulgaris subsp. vulgaris]|uniref:uncharacterized protein LOC104892809 n=1 Tax=Beta vulgaris subsp. vulgaris TaxID=3555 RepID=UPI002036D0F1|nr:uncharacterized protein LOC104892809 [Beta vulgaris subsp. vulgaris]
MHRSSSNTRVADDFYRNSSSFFSSPASTDGENIANNANTNGNLPMYSPGSHPAKKEKSRLRSAENAIHLIPLVLVLCAVILWFFSNPVEVVSVKPGSVGAKIEGLHEAVGVDGTQNRVHLELEDHDLLHHHQRQQHQTVEKKRLI